LAWITAVAQGLAAIAEKPAMQLTPEGLAARMDAAAEKSRAADRATLREAREAHQEASRIIHGIIGAVRGTDEQRKRLLWAAGGGLAAGCLLWSILPGLASRIAPESWHWPERLAARTLTLDMWSAGERLLAEAQPERWQTVVLANRILQGNRQVVADCARAANKINQSQHCVISIAPDSLHSPME
jgi:hypothetical protein